MIIIVVLAIEHLLLHANSHLCASHDSVLARTTRDDEFLLHTSHLQLGLRCLLRVNATRNSHFQHHLLLSQLLLLLLSEEMLLLLLFLKLLHQDCLLFGSQLLLFLRSNA